MIMYLFDVWFDSRTVMVAIKSLLQCNSTINFIITVGPSPNMLLPTINCQKVLVALEGEAFARGGNLIDPEGAIGLLKFPSSYISDTTYSYKVLDFRSFNDK